MDAIRVAVVSWTTIAEPELTTGIAALQQQLDHDFGPVWGIDAELLLIPSKVETTKPGHWGLVLLDRRVPEEMTDRREALHAYGRLTSDGHPLAKVFVDGERDWTHVASRVLLEMLVDPDGDAAVYRAADAPPHLLYARRICDPCAAPADGYERGGRLVADFVHPAWFGSAALGGTNRFDQQGRISRPFTASPGSSIRVAELASSPWQVPHEDGGGPQATFTPTRHTWPP
jgi:hypothetical protein